MASIFDDMNKALVRVLENKRQEDIMQKQQTALAESRALQQLLTGLQIEKLQRAAAPISDEEARQRGELIKSTRGDEDDKTDYSSLFVGRTRYEADNITDDLLRATEIKNIQARFGVSAKQRGQTIKISQEKLDLAKAKMVLTEQELALKRTKEGRAALKDERDMLAIYTKQLRTALEKDEIPGEGFWKQIKDWWYGRTGEVIPDVTTRAGAEDVLAGMTARFQALSEATVEQTAAAKKAGPPPRKSTVKVLLNNGKTKEVSVEQAEKYGLQVIE